MAAQDYISVVQQLYVSYFGRPADYYGLQNFSAQLDAMKAPKTFAEVNAAVQADKAGTTALSKLVNSFNSSKESTDLYGTDNSQIGIGKFVNAIYQNVLGRDADLEGFNFWVSAITSGTLTKANAASAITQAARSNTTEQGKLDAKTVDNKLAVATSFTTAIDTPAEITGYSGDTAAASARALLAGVNSTTDVTAHQAVITDTLATIVNAGTPGSSFVTTTGVDNVAGTAGNDTINVVAVNASGADATTLGASDVIDGGAGRDTVNIIVNGTNNATIAGNFKNVEVVNIDNTLATSAAVVDASKFGTSVTTLTQVAKANDVSNLGAATTATFKGATLGANLHVGATGVAGTGIEVIAAATAASAKIALDGVKGDAATATADLTNGLGATTVNVATLNVAGESLNNVTVSGTMALADADAATGNNLRLNIEVGTDADGKGLSTLTVNSAVKSTLTVANSGTGRGVTTVDAAASAGAITFDATGMTNVATVKTGAGKDVVTINTTTAVNNPDTSIDETANASVSTGANDDTITLKLTGAGKAAIDAGDGADTVIVSTINTGGLTVNGGAGNDSVDISAVSVTTKDALNGGEGTDTLVIGGKAGYAAGDYLLLDATATGFETLSFKGTNTTGYTGTIAGAADAAVDASALSKFTTLSFGQGGFVANVSDAQTVVLARNANVTGTDLSATHKDYVAATATAAAVYAGTLKVTVQETGSDVTLGAGTADVAVRAAATTGSVATTLAGDVQNLNVALTSANGATTAGAATGVESIASVTIDLDTDAAAGTAMTLDGLKTLVVTGAGQAVIDASNGATSTASPSGKLTTIDVSGMTAMVNVNDAGDQVTGATGTDTTYGYQNLSTTTITANDAVAETIKLGGALDTVNTNSTYAKMDTISGFQLAAKSSDATAVDAAKSDFLNVAGTVTFKAITVTATSLSGALLEAAASKTAGGVDQDAVVFTLGGDTYVYIDRAADGSATANNAFDNADLLVKLVGTFDNALLAGSMG